MQSDRSSIIAQKRSDAVRPPLPTGSSCRIAAGGAAALLLFLAAAIPAGGQNIFAYPATGQSQEQQERDRFACYNWAAQQTGYNPQAQQSNSTPAPPPQGGVFRGAAKGAALGAVGGAIGGDAGKGAAIGAATGGLFGAMRKREATAQQANAQSQQAAATAQQNATFNRAMAACLQGRGYTVN
jgi:hypothetical protein